MGIQTAAARKLAVPDLTTTTFTQLITATMIDSALEAERDRTLAGEWCPSLPYWREPLWGRYSSWPAITPPTNHRFGSYGSSGHYGMAVREGRRIDG